MPMKLLILTLLPLVSGCFLDQSPPATDPNSGTNIVKGVLNMFDSQGPSVDLSNAYVAVGFQSKKESAASLPHFPIERSQDFLIYTSLGVGSYAASRLDSECQTTKKPITSNVAVSSGYLPAGKISYALTGVGFSEITPDADNVYYQNLTNGFQGGTYQIKAEGSGSVPPFAGSFAVPETLSDVKVNSFDLPNATVVIKKGVAPVIEWKGSSYLSSDVMMVAKILVEGEKDIMNVTCASSEDALFQGTSTLKWTVPAASLNELPLSMVALVSVERLIFSPGKKDNLEVGFLTKRQVFAAATVE